MRKSALSRWEHTLRFERQKCSEEHSKRPRLYSICLRVCTYIYSELKVTGGASRKQEPIANSGRAGDVRTSCKR